MCFVFHARFRLNVRSCGDLNTHPLGASKCNREISFELLMPIPLMSVEVMT